MAGVGRAAIGLLAVIGVTGVTAVTGATGATGVASGGVLAAHAAQASGRPEWTRVSAPDVTNIKDNEPVAVSCTSATFCMAIDDYSNNLSNQAAAERWNGTRWANAGFPDTSNSHDNELTAVSCTSSSFCLAVGYREGTSHELTLVERWNGTSWRQLSSPNAAKTQDNELLAVSCTSPRFCMAVGTFRLRTTVFQTLAERWNGTSWKLVASPDSSSKDGNQLTAVSCDSAAFCMAGGIVQSNTQGAEALIAKWSGSGWKRGTLPVAGGANAGVTALSCTSVSFCMAVGATADPSTGNGSNLAESWDGSQWTQLTAVSPGSQFNQLSGVSCTSARFCMAVGGNGSLTPDQVTAEQWNGTTWAAVSAENSSSEQNNLLAGVSCPAKSFCASVGSFFDNPLDRSLAENWKGASFAGVSFPDLRGIEENQLTGVSCVRSTFCVAVGSYADRTAGALRNLSEVWNGSRWLIDFPPNTTSTQANELTAVSCTSVRFCMAIGDLDQDRRTLAERWNGTKWVIVPSLTKTGVNTDLTAVSCVSVKFCVAVGYRRNGIDKQPLAAKWNGSTWKPTAPIDLDPDNTKLDAVSCTSATFCMATGTFGKTNRALAEIWTGRRWIQVTAASPGTVENELFSVSCVSAKFCMGGGFYFTRHFEQVLTERWNGTSWKQVGAAGPRTQSGLSGLSCTSVSFCMATGDAAINSAANLFRTLIEEWNGTSWKRVTSPNFGKTVDNDLLAVSCGGAAFCMSAGDYENPISQNLAAEWSSRR